MLSLLMLQTQLPSMSRPTSKAPTTLYLISMIATIVEMISHPIVVEGTTTARWHGEWSYLGEMAVLWMMKRSCCEERTRKTGTHMPGSDCQSGADAAEVREGGRATMNPVPIANRKQGGLGTLSHPLLTILSKVSELRPTSVSALF